METAVVTGVSSGIGRSIAENLLQDGWKVYGLSRSDPNLNNERLAWLPCDLSQKELIKLALDSISEPTIDAVISNAGVAYSQSAVEISRGMFERTFGINVLAPMLVIGALREKITKATIISVSSDSDRIPEADMALYCSSKAANTMYFNALALELPDARVFSLLPDYVDTPMLRRLVRDNEDFDWSATIKPEDVARLCSGLISGEVAVESGANIIVVTNKLKSALHTTEKLYGFNTDTSELNKL